MDGDDGEDKPYGAHSVKGKTDRNIKKKADIYYTKNSKQCSISMHIQDTTT